MTHSYNIAGITCEKCVAKVKSELLKLGDITDVQVQLSSPQAKLSMQNHIPISVLQSSIERAGNYSITEEGRDFENDSKEEKQLISKTKHQHPSGEHHEHTSPKTKESIRKLAFSATLHCLAGCGVGEVLGMIIGTYFGMSMISTMILAISLGFVFGFALGIIPLLKKGFSIAQSFKIVLVAEGLSIAVMEAFEVTTQLVIPGVMEASLSDVIFWLGMGAALVVGFLAAFPVNYYLIKRGVRHQH